MNSQVYVTLKMKNVVSMYFYLSLVNLMLQGNPLILHLILSHSLLNLYYFSSVK